MPLGTRHCVIARRSVQGAFCLCGQVAKSEVPLSTEDGRQIGSVHELQHRAAGVRLELRCAPHDGASLHGPILGNSVALPYVRYCTYSRLYAVSLPKFHSQSGFG